MRISRSIALPTSMALLMWCAGLGLPWSPAAAQTSLDMGLTYLRSTQAADGSWGGTSTSLNTVLQTTATAARTLQRLGMTDANLTDALSFLAAQSPMTVDDLAQTVEVLAASGSNVTSLVASLKAAQRTDGGWGLDFGKAFPSEMADTLSALRALKAANALDSETASAGIGYLVGQQNTDGGWGVLKGQPSEVFYTAVVLLVLKDVQNLFDLTMPLSRGSQFLAAQQNPDGSVGGSVFETAVAFQALLRLTLDPAGRTATLSYLVSAQLSDGSWDEDAFSTALALRALKDAQTVAAAQIQAITLARLVDGTRTITNSLLAFQTLSISITTGTPDVVLEAAVQDGSGTLFSTALQGNEFLFDTRNLAAGTYTVIVRATDPTTGILVDQQTTTFTIETTVAVANAVLRVTPLFTHVGATETVAVVLSLTNRSNSAATLTIEHEVKTSSGALISSGTTSVPLSVDAPFTNIVLTSFSHTFAQSGDYPIQAKVFTGVQLLTTVTSSLSVAPNVRIEPSKTLTPTTVLPDGDKRIRIDIRLEGVEQQP